MVSQNNSDWSVVIIKTTGIIRRIDELGRIVVPKEMRNTLKIRDGENIEILLEEDNIILKKHSKIEGALGYTNTLASLLNNLTNNQIFITDREKIIATSGLIAEGLLYEELSKELMVIIDKRENFFSSLISSVSLVNNKVLEGYFIIVPIVSSADSIGLVIFYNEETISEDNKLLAKFAAELISNKVDIS